MQGSAGKTLPPPERLLRLPAVKQMVGLSTSTIYAEIRAGRFPPPVKLSQRVACWPASTIAAWIESRINVSRA